MSNQLETHSPVTDEELMLMFARGDGSKFDELFDRYRQTLYAFYRRRVPDRERAEELMQETFLVLLRSASRYERQAPFRSYLFAIAFRVLGAERRRAALRSFFFLPCARKEPSEQHGTDEVLWLRQALGRMEKMDREILMLREFEQLSYAEIAKLLHLPLNTVRSRLFRARSALRESLEGIVANESPLVAKGGRT